MILELAKLWASWLIQKVTKAKQKTRIKSSRIKRQSRSTAFPFSVLLHSIRLISLHNNPVFEVEAEWHYLIVPSADALINQIVAVQLVVGFVQHVNI
jgi:hypothetical protein